METIIRVSPSELNEKLLDKVKDFIGERKNVDVTILLRDFDPQYKEDLAESIGQANSGQSMTHFTMEEFLAYEPRKA